MADTSDYNGLESQGPDLISYASAKDYDENNSHTTVHDHQQQQPGHGWTQDDHSNNNSHPDDSVTTTNTIIDNGPTSKRGITMDRGDDDGGALSPISVEMSSLRQLGRGGSADGGSIMPDIGDNSTAAGDSSTTTKNKSNNSYTTSNKDSSSAESTPRRSAQAPRAKSASSVRDKIMVTSGDLSMLDMKTSWDGSATSGGLKGEATTSGDGSVDNKSHNGGDGGVFTYTKLKYRAGMLADPVKIAKEREREERVRQARERLEGERKKKLEELKEQQRLAQENRERQLEMRRQKIEDLRKRDTERRAAVEERRRMKEEIERLRKESILQKAEERVARYEAWRAGGRKGGRGHVLGFGSTAPRDVCLRFERPRRSSSHSALQSRHSPNGSDMDSMRPQRRALSACSAVRRHCGVVDVNQMGGNLGFEGSTPRHLSVSTSVLYSKRHSDFSSSTTLSPAHRPQSSLGLDTIQEGRRSFVGKGSSPSASMSSSYHASYPSTVQPSPVRMRERSSPRKQRPASVATSMPSFVGGEPAKIMSTTRSKSSDRMARDRSKTRPGRRKDKAVSKEISVPSKGKEDNDDVSKEEAEDEKDGGTGSAKKGHRVSLSIFDRLSTPKFNRHQNEQNKETPPKKESPIVRVECVDDEDEEIDKYTDDTTGFISQVDDIPNLSPRKAYSTTNLSSIKKKSSFRDKTTPKDSTSTPRHVTHRDTSTASPSNVRGSTSPAPVSKTSATESPRITPPPPSSAPAPQSAPSQTNTSQVATPGSEDGTAPPRGGVNQDITKEAYKAKMAERRRQAREKYEKEAEEERKRQEEERLAEEESERQEEEEQRRLEEETIRLSEEARKAEGERLQRAIEAEEKRRKEEAERLEEERKAKEESDRKAKEEAERIEKEKQERARKEEEERLERKKKLEMIMKRVKTEPAQDTSLKLESPTKSTGSSPNRSALASPEVQEMPPFAQEQENLSGSEDNRQEKEVPALMTTSEDSQQDEKPEPVLTPVVRSASSGDILDSAAAEEKKEMEKGDSLTVLNTPVQPTNGMTSEPSSEVKSRFRSPLLQQLVENKGGSDSPGTPKFKSPLLQNLLGKTKVGARMGLSASMGDLSLNKGTNQQSTSPSLSPAGSSKEISKAGQDEDKDVDESSISPPSPTFSSSTGNDQESFKADPSQESQVHLTNGLAKSDGEEDHRLNTIVTTAQKSSPELSPMGMIDSALGTSIEPHGDIELSTPDIAAIANGLAKDKQDNMEDSSLGLHYPEEDKTLSATIPEHYQSGQSSSQEETEEEEEEEDPTEGGSGQFEDYIDLLDSGSSGKAGVSLTGGTPIIAFEENSRRTADVGESLS